MKPNNPRVAILTAIQTEYEAVLQHVSNVQRRTNSACGTAYKVGSFMGNDGEWDVAIHITSAGQSEACFETNQIISIFNPDIVMFVGVAGGKPGKVEVGDVVVPTEVNYFEAQKVKKTESINRPKQHKPSRRLISAAQQEKYGGAWLNRIAGPRPNNVSVHLAPIVSGEKVITSSKSDIWKKIDAQFDKAVAIDMEGHGFYTAQFERNIPGIEIRGISDLLDNKNIAGQKDDDARQKIASEHAAAFAFELISNLDTTWIYDKAEAEPTLVTIKLEADKKNIPNIIRWLGDITQDESINLKEYKIGSLILSFSLRYDTARLLLSLWKGEVLDDLLPFPVIEITIPKANKLNPNKERILSLIEAYKHSNEPEKSRVESTLKELSKTTPEWSTALSYLMPHGMRIAAAHRMGVGNRSILKTIRVTSDLFDALQEYKAIEKVSTYRTIKTSLNKGIEMALREEGISFSGHSDSGKKEKQLIYGMPEHEYQIVSEIMRSKNIKTFAQTFRWLFTMGFKSIGEKYYAQMELNLD